MKISACLDTLFRQKPVLQSVKLCHKLGLDGFEFWRWDDSAIDQALIAKEETGLPVSAFCTLFTSLVDSKEHAAYLDGLEKSIVAAHRLNCKRLITQVGMVVPGLPRIQMRQNMVDGLGKCIPALSKADVTLLIEPLNPVDPPGAKYFLSHSDEAFSIVEELNSPHVKVLFDIYHQQVTEGRLYQNIFNNLDKIGHFHAAANPGRSEPHQGEINYAFIVKELESQGYNGYCGLEYFPTESVESGLKSFLDLVR
ncbi:hydroxypyruvate isomerase family protein [Rubellicoccus peritrichatus]|uniref:TIM barrel protein n=1 Tax=Rubellicoccus peritrichatus TaxID=3080537 RepID=A0AAQ3L638_9BACT|nr:TIM barrel protein [Puniceicoccus sp. CR14]WOO39746.1 TIM barrel protein [Puniceicoccus sp. CR14]